jgi:hypothetical protein
MRAFLFLVILVNLCWPYFSQYKLLISLQEVILSPDEIGITTYSSFFITGYIFGTNEVVMCIVNGLPDIKWSIDGIKKKGTATITIRLTEPTIIQNIDDVDIYVTCLPW